MIFKLSVNLYFLFSIIITLVLNFVHALNNDFENIEDANNDKKSSEQFYLILVDNELEEAKNNTHVKRDEKEQFLGTLVSEINNLIIGNIDTYKDTSTLEKLEQASTPSPFTKRGVDEDKDKYAYIISSLSDESLIYSYLSEDLVPLVNDLPNVKAIIPDIKITDNSSSSRNDNLKNLKNVNNWKNPCVKGNTYSYLSILSQDKYDDSKKNATYDDNYYYPGSAGEGINVFVIDSGFNFKHSEYSNNSKYYKNKSNKKDRNDRIVQCLISLDQYNIKYEHNDFCSYEYDNLHGSKVANMVGGLTNGVASKANIYGIATHRGPEAYTSTYIKALEYINNNYLNLKNPKNVEKYIHKTVINISNSLNFSEEQRRNDHKEDFLLSYLYKLIDKMSKKGSVFVVSAGNDAMSIDNVGYPCTFDNVICVGAIDNIGINDTFYETDEIVKSENNTAKYPDHDEWIKIKKEAIKRYEIINHELIDSGNVTSKSYSISFFSNYGKNVNIYAPGFVKLFYQNRSKEDISEYNSGTSFSAPIVAGVAATIMSEFPYYNFDTKKMLEHLNEIGLNNIIEGIKDGHPNVLINNGKHLSFPKTDEYMTCGHNTDSELCSKSNELQCFRHGCCLKDNVN